MMMMPPIRGVAWTPGVTPIHQSLQRSNDQVRTDSENSSTTSTGSSESDTTPVAPSLQEADLLKNRILQTHPHKSFHFSLIHMRKMAEPPVHVPRIYRMHPTHFLVGGHHVPFTKEMWENMKRRQRYRHHMDMIHEAIPYEPYEPFYF